MREGIEEEQRGEEEVLGGNRGQAEQSKKEKARGGIDPAGQIG